MTSNKVCIAVCNQCKKLITGNGVIRMPEGKMYHDECLPPHKSEKTQGVVLGEAMRFDSLESLMEKLG